MDDFLAAGPREILQPLLTRLLDVWKGSNPDLLRRQPEDVDTMRFLGLALNWVLKMVHGPFISRATSMPFFKRCLTQSVSRIAELQVNESFSDKPHVEPHAQKARVKHSPLQPGQDPLEHTPVLRLVGVLLWVCLRTCPDQAWAAARIARLTSSDEARAHACIRHAAQYLRWTLHFALFYEPVQDTKWHCYTDASWAPEGDYSHQAVAVYLGPNLAAWQSQRQFVVVLSSAEAELIASVW